MIQFKKSPPTGHAEGSWMNRIILAVAMVLLLPVALGCSQLGLGQPQAQEGPDIVRTAQLGEQWQMTQMRVHVAAGEESLVLLRLAHGDKVDGYFYLEEGEDIRFQIAGDSMIYQSQPPTGGDKITADRFSFTADPSQGSTYTLTFTNPTDTDEMVFLEVIHPLSGSLFFPISPD